MSIKENHRKLNIQCFFTSKILVTIAALVIGSAAFGQTIPQIGLKFGVTNSIGLLNTASGALQPGDLAGAPGYAQTNWNVLGFRGDNVLGTTNPVFNVLDSSGANSGITIQWEGANSWSVANGNTPVDQGNPDANLMNGYTDSNGNANVPLTNALPNGIYGQNNNNKPMIYVSGLSAWLSAHSVSQYDVVLYMDGDNSAGRTGEYWIQAASGAVSNITFGSDITTHVFLRDYNNFTGNPVYQQVRFTSNVGRVAGSGNYTVFTGLSGDSFVILSSEFATRSGINAIQIVPRATGIGPTVDPLLAGSTFTGGTARFRANAAGVLPMTFQWLKNGSPLSDGGNIAGSSTATLVISGASGADAASYSVTVTGPNGSTTTAGASLTVAAAAGGSYAEKIFTNNPIAYWRFNEIQDPSTNFSGASEYVNGYNATYGPLALNGFNGIAGPQSPDFPGFENGNSALQTASGNPASIPYPSSYITWAVAPPVNLNTNTATFCAWIKPNPVVQVGSCALIYERGGTDTSGFGYGANNNLGYTWNNQGNTFGFVSGLIPQSNVWSFVALVISPTNAIIYLYNTNGQFSATNTVTHTNGPWANPTMIGDDPNSTTIIVGL